MVWLQDNIFQDLCSALATEDHDHCGHREGDLATQQPDCSDQHRGRRQ